MPSLGSGIANIDEGFVMFGGWWGVDKANLGCLWFFLFWVVVDARRRLKGAAMGKTRKKQIPSGNDRKKGKG